MFSRARPPRLFLRPSLSPRAASLSVRRSSRKSNPWPDVEGGSDEQPKTRAWVATASRISNFLIIPTVLLYAVFFADFGEHEHVFQPPRRWLEAQKASFFSLSPEEQKLAGMEPASSRSSDQSSGAKTSWCVFLPVRVLTPFSKLYQITSGFYGIAITRQGYWQ
ncbi:hypothetical protein OH77DRAFT_1404354 [Trametes cingulata]|nr:hypothetical protein OH77DRAFT_1404354 [Trametes cingulata]